ncbi:MAG: ATP-binding protein, partial [Syntrophomonadaceae bacterium]|nr:ATP-binding protein [Syntrophomonadaceae bacterium]
MLVRPALVYSKYIIWYELYTVLILVHVLIFILGRALYRRREGAGFFLLGTAAIIFTAVNDILVANDVLYGPYIVDTGLFIFIFCQTMVLSARFSRSFTTVERLSEELQAALGQLETVNRTLEDKVQERTRELEQATAAAQAANKAKSDFLATISHEIRTPLHGLLGMSELLEATELQELQKEYAAAIKASGEMLLDLINDLLDHSRIEEGQLRMENVTYPLFPVIKSVVDLMKRRAGEKGLEFVFTCEDGLPGQVKGDPLRLQQVLLNLLGNAIKFTEQGKIALKVSSLNRGSDCAGLCFEVRDTGIGIPETLRPNLFKPFSQADSSNTRKYGGTGLGLSIAKKLVELMGGTIGYSSQVGQGSRFWFTLPWREPEAGAAAGVAKAGPQPAASPVIRGAGRILVVEDFALNRTLLLAQLEKLGLEAEAVQNGLEAINAVGCSSYHLILMDCRMPEMDGYETARKIRDLESGQGRRTPIVAVTASATPAELVRIRESGMDDYLVKPVGLQELSWALSRWLPESVLSVEFGAEAPPAAEPSFADSSRRQEVWRLAGGDRTFLAKVIKAFLEDMPVKLAGLQEGLGSGDSKKVQLQAHGMKSSSRFLGLKALEELCQELENLAGCGLNAEAQVLLA